MGSNKKEPKAGQKWRYPGTRGVGFVVEKPAETRHVIDRTLGGDVIYVSGRLTPRARLNSYMQSRCSLKVWLYWAYDAKEVKS